MKGRFTCASKLISEVSCFCSVLICVMRALRDSSHLRKNSPSLSLISEQLSLSSLTLASMSLIRSAQSASTSSTLLVSPSSLSSFAWFSLCAVMASSFCSIFSSRSRFSCREAAEETELSVDLGASMPFESISMIDLKYNIYIVTAMIYMRERKRKGEKEESGRNYIDELKSKFGKKNTKEEAKTDNPRKENDAKTIPTINPHSSTQKYAISKSKQGQNPSQSKFSESIIVHDLPQNPNPLLAKRSPLKAVKCFDIQIVNDLSSSRYRAQAYIQILEREKELKSREIMNLKEMLAGQKSPLREEVQQLRKVASEQAHRIDKYLKFFSEGKDLFLKTAMELVDSRNQLGQRQNEGQIRSKEQSLTRCIQKIQRMLSVYSNFLQFDLKRGPDELITVDELWNTVKYQEKIIELMRQNENGQMTKNYHHQNALLRYEVNRISTHNEQLIAMLPQAQPHNNNHYSNHHNNPQESIILHEESQEIEELSNEDSSIPEESQHTPFKKLKPELSPTVPHPFSAQEGEAKEKLEAENKRLLGENEKLKKEIVDCRNRIGVLQVEKEYVVDQLEQAQGSERQLKGELRAIMEQNNDLLEQVRDLKVRPLLHQDSCEVAQEAERAVEEQNSLLRDKLKSLLKPNDKETVTVEELLKLLKRKELAHYHQALMELISKYQQRISDLTTNYLYQRELKQQSLTYCKGLFNLVQAKAHSSDATSLEEIIDYINGYEAVMAQLKENEIDVLLRKIKSFSIGIDQLAAETIKEELNDYVYQLQTRLPTLSEEYFEDGSSIHSSAERIY